MSTAPAIPKHSDDTSQLSRDQWWALFEDLRLAQQTAYTEVGGPVAFLRQERDADAPSA